MQYPGYPALFCDLEKESEPEIYFLWNAATQTPGAQVALIDHLLNEDSTSAWASPVAVDLQGNLLISDDQSGTIFKMTYQDPLSAADHLPNGQTVTVAPSPAHKSTTVSITGLVPMKATFTLVNLQGSTLWENTQQIGSGTSKVTIATAALSAGVYLLQVITPSCKVTRKVLVQKK